MWLLYNVLLTLLAPFWVPWMVWRARKRGEQPNWRERQGDYREAIPKKGDRPRLWVHAVSVGEVVAARPVLRELRRRLPKHEIVLSVTTSSGHQTAREGDPGLFDYLVYLPIDVPRFTLNAMARVRPEALIVMETELWMNLFWAAKTMNVKTFVANGRLSDRSFPRAQKLGFFYRALFRMVDWVLAQTETDAERFRQLGMERVERTGNVKFDGALEELDLATDWRRELHLDARPVVVVGSLRAEEFPLFARVFSKVEGVQWVVAPRHLERTPELLESLKGIVPSERIGRRSQGTAGDLTLLDTYGELARVYALGEMAVVGGSFAKVGMQNPIQPMAQGKPVLHGPFVQNARDVVAMADGAGAAILCADGDDLAQKIDELLRDPSRLAQMGTAARRLVEENRGASERMASAIASRL